MAEVLGTVASSIQLVDAAFKIGENIYKFIDNIRSAPKKVETFRRDLDQTLDILKEIQGFLKVAETKYNNLGDTAKLVENTLEDFKKELAECCITVETLYARSKSWKYKIKIGMKGDGEWVRIDARIMVQYSRLTAASVQLSNKLGLENGERLNDIGNGVTAIGIEITQNVSEPVRDIRNDVRNIRTNGSDTITLIQESMALQVSHNNRAEKIHEEQFQRITEIRDTFVVSQTENKQAFNRIEDTCQTISDQQCQVSDAITKLETEMRVVSGFVNKWEQNKGDGKNIPASELKKLLASAIPAGVASIKPTSKDERIRFEAQKRKITVLIRRILTLADGSPGSNLIKGAQADEYSTTIQEFIDTLQDDSEIGNILKQEVSKITLQLLGTNSVYMQKTDDPRLRARLERKVREGENMMADLGPSMVENKEARTERAVEDGTIIVSSRYQRRVAPSPFGEDDEVESSRTVIHYNPKVGPGETKTAFAALFANTSGTLGSSSIPLLLRVYHRRDYNIYGAESGMVLAGSGQLDKLQRLLASGETSIYDINNSGRSLLHEAVRTISSWNNTKRGFAPGCFAVCQFLLDQGADTNIIDDYGATPLSLLATTLFEQRPTYLNVEIARTVFNRLLDSGIENRISPFGPEQAIARMLRSFMAGPTWFFNQLLEKLNCTAFDINNYQGCSNAVMLEFAVVPSQDDAILFRNYEIAVKHGGDISARTWTTGESCLHLLLHKLAYNCDDIFIKNEVIWQSFKKRQCKAFEDRLKKMLSLGADIYATDDILRELVGGVSFGRSVTRAMYEYEVQDIWWVAILEFGFEKEAVMRKEAEEIGVSVNDYEGYLVSLAKASFEARQSSFEERRLKSVQADSWMVPDPDGNSEASSLSLPREPEFEATLV
ncbi:hypothetical protein TWF718_000610 [Orbilia javanica]|uniref:Fungal N-terminal domain-containing protein n=1 Tax=Orbilia javanica TaxID=47235 RepID=A0AAN8MZX9_9PEZI